MSSASQEDPRVYGSVVRSSAAVLKMVVELGSSVLGPSLWKTCVASISGYVNSNRSCRLVLWNFHLHKLCYSSVSFRWTVIRYGLSRLLEENKNISSMSSPQGSFSRPHAPFSLVADHRLPLSAYSHQGGDEAAKRTWSQRTKPVRDG
jgi:hypothetical protein